MKLGMAITERPTISLISSSVMDIYVFDDVVASGKIRFNSFVSTIPRYRTTIVPSVLFVKVPVG